MLSAMLRRTKALDFVIAQAQWPPPQRDMAKCKQARMPKSRPNSRTW
jgi:hypothetical protein